MDKSEAKKEKVIRGTVISDKMDQTITVLVNRIKTNRLYKKKYTVSKKYAVHDPENQYHVGDNLDIKAGRPISRNKCYVVAGRSVAK